MVLRSARIQEVPLILIKALGAGQEAVLLEGITAEGDLGREVIQEQGHDMDRLQNTVCLKQNGPQIILLGNLEVGADQCQETEVLQGTILLTSQKADRHQSLQNPYSLILNLL